MSSSYAARVDVPIYRGDISEVTWLFYDKGAEGEETKTDLASVFADIKLQIRTGQNSMSRLINSYSVLSETLIISDTNVLNADLSQDVAEGIYYYDLEVIPVGSEKGYTYLYGVIQVTNDITA